MRTQFRAIQAKCQEAKRKQVSLAARQKAAEMQKTAAGARAGISEGEPGMMARDIILGPRKIQPSARDLAAEGGASAPLALERVPFLRNRDTLQNC